MGNERIDMILRKGYRPNIKLLFKALWWHLTGKN